MIRRPPRSTLPDTLFPDPTLFRSQWCAAVASRKTRMNPPYRLFLLATAALAAPALAQETPAEVVLTAAVPPPSVNARQDYPPAGTARLRTLSSWWPPSPSITISPTHKLPSPRHIDSPLSPN